MKHILPLLSVALIATAVITEPNSAQPVAPVHAANTSIVRTQNVPFAPLTLKQHQANQYKLVAKGTQKKSTTSKYAANVLKQNADLLPVFNQTDILPKHQKIANDALKKLPAKCWDTLQHFYVRYDNPKSRGLAGATTMILDGNVSDDEFRALFMHEIGHVFDLNQKSACLGGTISSGASEFKDGDVTMYNDDPSLEFYRISWDNENTMKTEQTSDNFVSGYAKTNVFEDFAESHTLFVLHNSKFREMAMQNYSLALKYNFFVKNMYPNGVQIAKSDYAPDGKRVWDTTKLPYEWL